MPQMNKGGKFIFGKSLIRTDGTLRIPPQAMEEYHIADEGKVYLFTGSKITGGFCVTRKGYPIATRQPDAGTSCCHRLWHTKEIRFDLLAQTFL